MKGVFSIAEAVDLSNKNPSKCIFTCLREYNGLKFDLGQWKSLDKTAKIILDNGARVFESLEDTIAYLNGESI